MSDEWVFGVDGSFDTLTLEEAQRLKAAGVQVYAQCLWIGAEQPAGRVISLRNAWLAGLALVGYISVSSGRPGWAHVNAGRAGVPEDLWAALVKVPIDVELEGLSFEGHVVAALNAVAELGKPRDVYTSFNAWVNLLGHPTRPHGVGLWNAFWDEDPDVDFPRLAMVAGRSMRCGASSGRAASTSRGSWSIATRFARPRLVWFLLRLSRRRLSRRRRILSLSLSRRLSLTRSRSCGLR